VPGHRVDAVIGRTPVVRLERVATPEMAEVWIKLEGANPGGSIKDRTALGMILDAEARGILKPGDTIVEPTSGNTGIGLAQVASARGYRLILCLPDSASDERKRTLEAYGAELVLTDPSAGCSPPSRRRNRSGTRRERSCRTSSRTRPIRRSTTTRRRPSCGRSSTAGSTRSYTGPGREARSPASAGS
jgi:cysteine synthase